MLRELGGRRRRRVILFVCIQVLIPSAMLVLRFVAVGSRPTIQYPLAWQMYSAAERGVYVGTKPDGSSVPLSVDGLPLVLRSADYGSTVPDRLCELGPGFVQVERVGGQNPARIRC